MLERKRNNNLIRNRLVALLVACYFLFAYLIFLPTKTVYASETLQHHYETSSVVEDLESLEINTTDSYDTVKLLYFLEYGYGYDGLYSIYLYTYIPLNNTSISNIIYDSSKNAITFGFTDTEEDVLRVDYHKLKISTKNTESKEWYFENENKTGVFVKWKVDLSENNFILNESAHRYYCVSGIELQEKRNPTATEFLVGNIYDCYKNEEGKDMVIVSANLPTVSVDTYHTFFRTGSSELDNSLGSGWQDQISSCYFSLPKYIGNVGTSFLSSIKATFDYKYTTPILVLGDDSNATTNQWKNDNVYTAFLRNSLFQDTCLVGNRLYFYANYKKNSYIPENSKFYHHEHSYDLFYGNERIHFVDFGNETNSSNVSYKLNNLGWLFYDENLINYIEDEIVSEDYFFDGDNLLNYYEKYKNDSNINSYLFEQVSDNDNNSYSLAGLKYGKNTLTYGNSNNENVDISKITFSTLLSNSVGGTFWENLGNALSTWWAELFNKRAYKIEEICPFERVDYTDVYALTDDELSKKYFVDINEITSFRNYCKESLLINKDVWLFRYDASEYYSSTAFCSYTNAAENPITYNATGFVARQPVYLDFDILQFGFTQEGKEFTIPVEHSPENVFNDLTAQQDVDYSFLTNFMSYVTLLLFAIAIVVVIIVFWPFFRIVFSGIGLILKIVFKIVFFPFRLLGNLFKSKNNDDDS